LLSSAQDRASTRPRLRPLCRTALAALALCAIAQAGGAEALRYSYYTVEAPPRGGSLYAAVTAASAIREDGETYLGHTHWKVAWSFEMTAQDDGSCRVSAVSTDLTAEIILPRLSGGDARQVAMFDKYISALREHELGHYENGRAAAGAVRAGLLAAPMKSSCDETEERLHAQSRATVARFNEKDREYDRRTEHGVTQGAQLPD
jgi:predicted secreted Zn-dependent protease